jgi:hypothetical protein
MFNVPYKIRFQTLNSNSAVSVKYLDESWDHTVWYYSIEATTTIKKKTKQKMLIYEITILNQSIKWWTYKQCQMLIMSMK